MATKIAIEHTTLFIRQHNSALRYIAIKNVLSRLLSQLNQFHRRT